MIIAAPRGRAVSDGADTKRRDFRIGGVGSELRCGRCQLVSDGVGSVRKSDPASPCHGADEAWHSSP